jgi:dTDP-4-dehydrorhamnose 3,5-epimerase
MNVRRTALDGVLVLEPRVFADARGAFLETWSAARYAEAGIPGPFVQDNLSRSVRHVLRGLHYQIEQPQGKLVWAVAGEVFDVAVDLRRSSATFGRWIGERLSGDAGRQLWVPPGFAHGFLVLSEWAHVAYKCTAPYAPAHERTVRWDDPALMIAWPLPPGVSPIVSDKDAGGLTLAAAHCFP